MTVYNRREFLAGLSGAAVLSRMQTRSQLQPKLYYSSATALAEAIRTKKLSAVEVANVFLKRIEEVNPKLNAVFQVDPERVRKEAQAADTALARGQVNSPWQKWVRHLCTHISKIRGQTQRTDKTRV